MQDVSGQALKDRLAAHHRLVTWVLEHARQARIKTARSERFVNGLLVEFARLMLGQEHSTKVRKLHGATLHKVPTVEKNIPLQRDGFSSRSIPSPYRKQCVQCCRRHKLRRSHATNAARAHTRGHGDVGHLHHVSRKDAEVGVEHTRVESRRVAVKSCTVHDTYVGPELL